MPTYNYICEQCKTEVEIFHAMSDKTKRVCGKCKGIMKRLIGNGSGIIFKGDGFYCTTYPKNKKKGDKRCGD